MFETWREKKRKQTNNLQTIPHAVAHVCAANIANASKKQKDSGRGETERDHHRDSGMHILKKETSV